ncbi:hypothetical protein TFLX_00451 [Thermoflexales bacterium]|nr:hypothetical protein TFLX_00451 [Thermoflexales bacterium]
MGFDDLRQQSIAVQEQHYVAESQSLMDRMPLFKDLKPRERFVVALFIFMDVTVLGFGCLLVADRMMP